MNLRILALLGLVAGAELMVIAMPSGAQSSPREIVVVMDNMNFGRLPGDAKVGDVIIWDNRDTVQHTATARDGSFDVRLQPGKKGRTVLTRSGDLAIYCIYHPMMRATLKVGPA